MVYGAHPVKVFGEGFNTTKFSWFGIIRGTNDYRTERYIAQIGLNRYQDSSYFLYELAKNPLLVKELKQKPYSQHQKIIKERITADDGITVEAGHRELLAELEQNLFRGTIRSSKETEDYHFYLFTSFRHRVLLDAISGL